MANARVEFYSDCLKRFVTFQIIIPNDLPKEWMEVNPHYQRPMKTLFLLHGFSGNNMDWMLGSLVNELAGNYNLAVVCPAGENAFYLDGPQTGRKYASYVGEELVQYVRNTFGLAKEMEDTYIGGLSMGGFGAIHTALQFNHNFVKAFGLSSALIIHDVEHMKPGEANEVANYDYYRMVFGDLKELSGSINNPEELIRRHRAAQERIPAIYMACGTEDGLLANNHAFRDFLKENDVEHVYCESAGVHNWAFWNQYLEPAIQWMLEK
ncbi:MAG: alpha/beta hydrolase-fold protein [Lachnospiraceae bacterium]|nr:alpha/beta hydrolase-fold protein [Lachnospiraceae bacterium]